MRIQGVALLVRVSLLPNLLYTLSCSYRPLRSGLCLIHHLRMRITRPAVRSYPGELNAAVVRAERRQEAIELAISAKESTLALYANEPGFTRELKMPDGIVIEAAPERLILLPGAAVPGVGIQVANRHGSRRIIHLDPMTGFPRVEAVESK